MRVLLEAILDDRIGISRKREAEHDRGPLLWVAIGQSVARTRAEIGSAAVETGIERGEGAEARLGDLRRDPCVRRVARRDDRASLR